MLAKRNWKSVPQEQTWSVFKGVIVWGLDRKSHRRNCEFSLFQRMPCMENCNKPTIEFLSTRTEKEDKMFQRCPRQSANHQVNHPQKLLHWRHFKGQMSRRAFYAITSLTLNWFPFNIKQRQTNQNFIWVPIITLCEQGWVTTLWPAKVDHLQNKYLKLNFPSGLLSRSIRNHNSGPHNLPKSHLLKHNLQKLQKHKLS